MSGFLFAMSWGIVDAQSERPELQVDPLLGNAQAIAAGQSWLPTGLRDRVTRLVIGL